MSHLIRLRALALGLSLAAVAALSAGVWAYSYAQALEPLAARGRADLALAADRLVSQLARYRETAVLLADHPVLTALHAGGDPAEANRLLQEVADKTSALAVIYAGADGRILAGTGDGSLDRPMSEAAHFQRAMQGALGFAYGEAAGLAARAFVYAAPDFAPGAAPRGTLVVAVDMERMEQGWAGASPPEFFTDPEGRIVMANRSELVGWRETAQGMETGLALSPVTVRRVSGETVWRHDFSPYVASPALHLVQDLPVVGLRAESLVDVAPALRLAGLQAASVAALCLFFGSLLFVVTGRRRALAEANAVLEDRVRARTQALETANTALRHEVAEREEAEAALKRAQADLVQAGKLSALGQMSAGISHELNQPLMAIRQFSENGAAFLDKGEAALAAANFARITDLAHRAARIIRNLRAFARNESEPMGRVDLVAVLTSAVELTEVRLRGDSVALDWTPPAAPLWVLGGEVRLAQVFVNLINNAADAMAGQSAKRIGIAIAETPAGPRVTVRDHGPGIADPERMFEPFYSTKTVGEGMGLGLSISYGLVQSFGGEIRGRNLPGGGAEFTVALEPWRAEAAA
ncbi:ATP-binding protein [Thetidibacter halocola]|uniref:C4-dicarboxylate transport sensor protein DctB n=1 Tax=Thetidibacter halocola TaxID=2827239 RepID=A0A8J8B6T7_9RHOB|nr:ATP-binding protein [Thetidibacter halocola]MBS0124366.1 sensor histidine kinase [Thetidibacter halocola]